MEYVYYVYKFIKHASSGMDAIYEDYIRSLVGIIGLDELLAYDLLETCGNINGRQLYVLREFNIENLQ